MHNGIFHLRTGKWYGEGEAEAFPADFIAEGVDQTTGWFYTLHALGVLLFDSVAYKTVVSNGLVLDKNGNKMSKRLGNVVIHLQPSTSLAPMPPAGTLSPMHHPGII